MTPKDWCSPRKTEEDTEEKIQKDESIFLFFFCSGFPSTTHKMVLAFTQKDKT